MRLFKSREQFANEWGKFSISGNLEIKCGSLSFRCASVQQWVSGLAAGLVGEILALMDVIYWLDNRYTLEINLQEYEIFLGSEQWNALQWAALG